MLLPSCAFILLVAQVYVCSFFFLSIRSPHFYKKIVVHFKRLALSFNLLAKGSSILYAFIHLVWLLGLYITLLTNTFWVQSL